MSAEAPILSRLAQVIEQRYADRPAGSYTSELFAGGHAVMAAKIIEEAYELVATGAEEERPVGSDVIHEAADLVYHVMVFTTAAGVAWRDVERELERRFGGSLPSTSSPSNLEKSE